MRVLITKQQSRNLKFNQNPTFVRACFFLGMGTMQIAEIMNLPFHDELIESYIDSAMRMGMSDTDVVVIKETHEGSSSIRDGITDNILHLE